MVDQIGEIVPLPGPLRGTRTLQQESSHTLRRHAVIVLGEQMHLTREIVRLREIFAGPAIRIDSFLRRRML